MGITLALALSLKGEGSTIIPPLRGEVREGVHLTADLEMWLFSSM
jgi:hypothetical protein